VSFWDSLVARLETLGELVVEWTILILVAVAVLIVGRWLIGLIRTWTEKLLASRPMQPVWDRSGVSAALQGTEQTPASIGATVVYAYLMVALFLVVVRILRLVTLEALLERLLAWIPLLLLAALIVIVSAAAGNWAANLVRPFADEQGVPWLAKVVHVGIILFGVLFALELMRIEFAEDIIKIVVAAIAVALAIAFGVGGIDAGKKWWARFGTPSAVADGVSSSAPVSPPPPPTPSPSPPTEA
jgi:hypothetical protein